MAFSDYALYSISFNEKEADWISAKSQSITFDYIFTTSGDITKVQNAGYPSDFTALAICFFNQKAIERTINEIYKKPSDYLSDYNNFIENRKNLLNKQYNNYNTSTDKISNQKNVMIFVKNNSTNIVKKLQSIKDIVYKI